MRNKVDLLTLALLVAMPVFAVEPGAPSSLLARTDSQTHSIVLDVLFSNQPPDRNGPYSDASKWTVLWRAGKTDPWRGVGVSDLTFGENSVSLLLLPLYPPRPDPAPSTISWNVSFASPGMKTTTLDLASTSEAKASCDAASTNKPYFCPVSKGATPDLSLSGSFLAGGGTNPIYSFELKGGVFFPRPKDKTTQIPKSDFQTGINTQVEINQNPKPPVHRTRFDPDSITAGFALTDMITFNKDHELTEVPPDSKALVGMRFQAQLPAGEFCRSDPSSNIIASGITIFDLKPWHPRVHPSFYATLYPFLGMEAGRNLNHPSIIDKVPIDLSHYEAIVRGYMGADAAFVKVSKDRKQNVFSLTGTYRVRLPAIDEPLIETLHQTTSVSMTTKARNWVEADMSYTVPAWQYLAISAKYQYGELPPLFPLVDHKFTVGFTLQLAQPGKAVGSQLVQ